MSVLGKAVGKSSVNVARHRLQKVAIVNTLSHIGIGNEIASTLEPQCFSQSVFPII